MRICDIDEQLNTSCRPPTPPHPTPPHPTPPHPTPPHPTPLHPTPPHPTPPGTQSEAQVADARQQHSVGRGVGKVQGRRAQQLRGPRPAQRRNTTTTPPTAPFPQKTPLPPVQKKQKEQVFHVVLDKMKWQTCSMLFVFMCVLSHACS